MKALEHIKKVVEMSKKESRDVKDLLIAGLLVFALVITGMQAYALVELQSKINELEDLSSNAVAIDTGKTSSVDITSSNLPGMVGGC